MERDMDYGISVVSLLSFVLKKWIIILICSVIMASGLFSVASIKTKQYYTANSTITVYKEDAENPVDKIGVINNGKLIKKALQTVESSTSVDEAYSNIVINREPYGNDIYIKYRTVKEHEAHLFLGALLNEAKRNINENEQYSIAISVSSHQTGVEVIGPNKTKYCIIGFAFGFVISVAIIALIYILEKRVRDEESIDNQFHYSILANLKDYSTGIVKLRAAITLGYKDINVIAMSSFDKDGSSIAKQLAISLSSINKKVLLIEPNDNPGINSIICNDADFNKLILMEDGVTILSYQETEDFSDIIQTQEFNSLLLTLKNTYDYVIINTPTINSSASCMILDALVDGVVLVVTKDKTKIDQMIKNKSTLELVKANVLGVAFVDNEI